MEMEPDPALHSRRPLNLRFDIPTGRTQEFWESLKKGRFVTTKCSSCGFVSFPPQADCPSCNSGESSWVELSKDATLLTFTRVLVPPSSFVGAEPYVIAIGQLEGGPKVLAWLEGASLDLKPGLKMKVETRESGGNAYYVFVPA